MSGNLFSLRTAALPVSVSALLHIFAFVPDGLNAGAGMMFGIGIVYILMAIGLRRNLRWVAWLTFLAMTFGAVAAYIVSGGGTALHNGWFLTIAVIDLAAAILLFICLWRSDQSSQRV
jgi:uncharacterized membrane protein (DUF2068 family)